MTRKERRESYQRQIKELHLKGAPQEEIDLLRAKRIRKIEAEKAVNVRAKARKAIVVQNAYMERVRAAREFALANPGIRTNPKLRCKSKRCGARYVVKGTLLCGPCMVAAEESI